MLGLKALNGDWRLEEVTKVLWMSTERYHVNVTYPEYALLGRSLSAFNAAVFSDITGYVADFTDMAGRLTLPDGRKSELAGVHVTFAARSRFITAKMNLRPHLGGAHPGHDILTMTFDTSANAIISISDFFIGESALERLSVLAEKALFAAYPELSFAFNDPTFRKGFAPEEENFSRWALTDSEIILFFPEYQVAPYAAGALDVKIPYTDMENMLSA